jgi:hypothetical protein
MHQSIKTHQLVQLQMFHKKPIAKPTAAHAMKQMLNKELMPKELDTSVLLVISV